MTNSARVNVIGLLAFAMLVFAASSWAQTKPPIAEQAAKEFGIDSFGQIEAIRYTFNVQFPGVHISRSWIWEPKTGQVSYEGKDKDGKAVKATYVRSQLGRASTPEGTDKGMQKLPIGKGTAEQLVVKYPAEAGGYTPGDTWELFIGPDKRVREFVYRRGGATKPSIVIASWTDYKKAGPLLVATDHRGTADGKPFRLVFSDVAVKLTGSDAWLNAK